MRDSHAGMLTSPRSALPPALSSVFPGRGPRKSVALSPVHGLPDKTGAYQKTGTGKALTPASMRLAQILLALANSLIICSALDYLQIAQPTNAGTGKCYTVLLLKL